VRPDRSHALWLLPLIAGSLPAVATLAAWLLSIRLELIPACNPFLDGCVSISRAARYELPNHIFRACVLPAAALQALTWLLCAAWLKGMGAVLDRPLRALPVLGVMAGLFLVLYGTFLGSEGDIYRWMRRYGVIVYFGATCLCMVICAGHLHALRQGGWLPFKGRLDQVPLMLCVLLLVMGLVNGFSPLFMKEQTQDRLGNALEWGGATVFTIFFVCLAALWRTTRFQARLSTER
jgi:hypothetical protein